MRLYYVRVDIAEAATRYRYPAVTHVFYGRTRAEAWGYHDAHRKTDAFLRGCETRGRWRGVTCRAHVAEGWTRAAARRATVAGCPARPRSR